MDHQLILAVAGSGKTTHIVNHLNLEKRSLVITYTINNYRNLRDCILKKFGYFPENIIVMEYFSFLYSFCYLPLLSFKFKAKGIHFKKIDKDEVEGKKEINRYIKSTERAYYVDQYNRLYGNRIAKLLEIKGAIPAINSRLEKYFDNLFIDEIQDFAGHDFNLLKQIAKSNIDMIFVGDFFQHTFDTSRDGTVNMNLHSSYDKYVKLFVDMGFTIDKDILKNSYRCSPTVCKFIKNNLGIEIDSDRTEETCISIVDNQEQADKYFNDGSIVKLFFSEHYNFNCYSRNWGETKGENHYYDVCVVLTKIAARLLKANKLNELSPQSKNKLYVACSRANNNLYIVEDQYFQKYKVTHK